MPGAPVTFTHAYMIFLAREISPRLHVTTRDKWSVLRETLWQERTWFDRGQSVY
jgi:hypothetical protein